MSALGSIKKQTKTQGGSYYDHTGVLRQEGGEGKAGGHDATATVGRKTSAEGARTGENRQGVRTRPIEWAEKRKTKEIRRETGERLRTKHRSPPAEETERGKRTMKNRFRGANSRKIGAAITAGGRKQNGQPFPTCREELKRKKKKT